MHVLPGRVERVNALPCRAGERKDVFSPCGYLLLCRRYRRAGAYGP
jgi:hypothetical protein